MPEISTSIFQELLNPGEKVLWRGKPRQGFVFWRSDIFFIPFSIVWAVLAYLWEFETAVSNVPFQDKFWSIFSLSVAAYILLLRFFVDLAYRYLTFYALTNQRVLIHTGLFKTTLTSLPLADLKEINLDLHKNGRGDIVFGPLDPKAWIYTGGGWPKMGGQTPAPAFEMLKDAEKVYKQILAQQKKAK
ncbi:MAG: PH domain-containing protein [Anaerolineae bacterium]|nr:PH domain-containing protein [Anaerolineae bacterium]